MKKITSEELKKIEVKGLKYLDKVCKKSNIKYLLAYGSLLGAVRHKGFIPWDDDIDIWMMRSDYDKFIEVMERIENDEWELLTFKNKGYYFPWAKLCHKKSKILPSRFFSGKTYGISIDIFPLDYSLNNNITEAKKEMNQIIKKIKNRYRFILPYTSGYNKNKLKYNIKKIWFKTIGHFFDNHVMYINNIENKLRKQSSGNLLICPFSPVPCILETNEVKDDFMLEFEGYNYQAPKEYDSILKKLYGDYMSLPPIEKRKTHHSFEVYENVEEK